MYTGNVNIQKQTESEEDSSNSGTWPSFHRDNVKQLPNVYRELKRDKCTARPMRLKELLQRTKLEKSAFVVDNSPQFEEENEYDASIYDENSMECDVLKERSWADGTEIASSFYREQEDTFRSSTPQEPFTHPLSGKRHFDPILGIVRRESATLLHHKSSETPANSSCARRLATPLSYFGTPAFSAFGSNRYASHGMATPGVRGSSATPYKISGAVPARRESVWSMSKSNKSAAGTDRFNNSGLRTPLSEVNAPQRCESNLQEKHYDCQKSESNKENVVESMCSRILDLHVQTPKDKATPYTLHMSKQKSLVPEPLAPRKFGVLSSRELCFPDGGEAKNNKLLSHPDANRGTALRKEFVPVLQHNVAFTDEQVLCPAMKGSGQKMCSLEPKVPVLSDEQKHPLYRSTRKEPPSEGLKPKSNPLIKDKLLPHVYAKDPSLESRTGPTLCPSDGDQMQSACTVPEEQRTASSVPEDQRAASYITNGLLHSDSSSVQMKSVTITRKVLRLKDKDYLLHGKLGCGGSSVVFTVEELLTSETFALKLVDLANVDEETSRSYLNEVHLLIRLQDKETVIRLHDHVYVEGQQKLYMLMEVGETDLAKLVKTMSKTNKIPMPLVIAYWTEMLRAVKDIHDEGIVHADLKPANFLMVKGRLKLIDFGIASSVQVDMTSTYKDSPAGTYNYMSPEAINDPGSSKCRSKIGYKSDVWSLGCILYNLLYGHTPFQHITNSWAKLSMILNPAHKIALHEVVDCPAVLFDALEQCLQYDPKRRPTVAELLDLRYVGAGRQTTARIAA